ncbi:MAG: hypothetical protein A2V86_11225 [Deltaproteobacteria bacterium RBG_16_49_23]|nr:MAG: hypothetical protein A2V86_11225 [Deltaproteobacteria bacterium RBG_16_49_23]
MDREFLTLKEIEGVVVHDLYLKKEVARRSEAFEYLDDVEKMTQYIGGERVASPPIRCDWMVKKIFYPEVECYFLYNHKDQEFPSSMQVLFSGKKARELKGDDLAVLSIATINHMIHYIRLSNPGRALPEICLVV